MQEPEREEKFYVDFGSMSRKKLKIISVKFLFHI
jgi:hypothetical protein